MKALITLGFTLLTSMAALAGDLHKIEQLKLDDAQIFVCGMRAKNCRDAIIIDGKNYLIGYNADDARVNEANKSDLQKLISGTRSSYNKKTKTFSAVGYFENETFLYPTEHVLSVFKITSLSNL